MALNSLFVSIFSEKKKNLIALKLILRMTNQKDHTGGATVI